MADERVTIKIDVKADTSQIDRVKRKLAEMCAQAEACEKQLNDLGGATRDTDADMKDLDKTSRRVTKNQSAQAKSTKNLSSAQKKLGYVVKDNRTKFDKLAGVLKVPFRLAVIGAALETAGLALALSSVNGLLATGRFLVKAYHMAMSGLAKAAAAAGLALATVAAAQRQYIAAQASGRYGGSFGASSLALRTLTGDARLASLGMKTLTGAFQAASKNAPVTKGTASALAGLMDFAYLSGDIEKGTAALATFVSLIQKGGPGGKGVAEAAKELGPEFEKAFKEISRGGKATTAELMKAFSGGKLSQSAGISGTASNVSGSLVGQLKAAFVEAQLLFGDLGMQIIKDVQKAFESLRKIFTRTFRQLTPTLMAFSPRFLDGLVNFSDKLAQFIVKLMREYVPRVEGFFEAMSKFWKRLTNGFEKFSDYLNQFSKASKIINKFFGDIFKRGFGTSLRRNFEDFGGKLVENQEQFDKFGKKLSELINNIFRLFASIRNAFFEALPAINAFIGGISGVVVAIRSLIDALAALGPYGALLGLFGSAMLVPGRRGRGGFLRGRAGAGVLARNRVPIAASLGSMALGSLVPGVGTTLGVAGIGAYAGRALASSEGFALKMLGLATPGGGGGRMAAGAQRIAGALAYASPMTMMGAGATLAAGGYLSNKAMNFVENRYGNTAATTGAGAAAGATTGAAVGTFFAGPTGGLSIAVGAAIGAIVGGITGWIKSGEAKKKAREAGRNFAGDYADAIEEILSTNNIDDAKTALVAFDAELASFAEGQSRSKELTKEAQKVFEEERKSLDATITVMDNRIEDLGKVSNLTKNQIIELANAMEVHLGNSAIQLWEIMSVTGIAVRRFGEDFQHYITDTFASDVEQILGDVAILNAPVVKNEIAQGFVDALKAGDAGTPEFGEFLQGIQDQNLMQFGAMGADRAMVSMLGETFGAPGAAAFMPGGFFGARGVTPADFTDEQRTIYNQYMGRRKESYAGAAAENIFSMLAQRGKLPAGMTVERLTNLLVKNNSIQDIMNLSQRTGQGDLFFEAEGRRGIVYNNLETQLTGLFDEFNIDLGQNIKLEETNDQKMLQGIKDFVTGTGDFKGAANDVFAIAVDKFDLAVDRLPGDDTATPRSNIVNTLGAHGRFDAMIAGKRSVMSGLRNWNLGSPSSDHASGRAYDLVGQNLGLYQMAVRASGGYAEFHGGSSGRHLHVVPGMNAPIGDTATPYMGMATVSSGGNSVTNVSMTVNAAPGMDVNALAAEVIYRLEQETRSNNERY